MTATFLQFCNPAIVPCTIAPMARYTLVYGVRLIPEGTLKGVEEATLKLETNAAMLPKEGSPAKLIIEAMR